ncbi:acyltransferase family protein [Mucilaginibacter sp.]|uniref:acyltransferase family protein n=1 Tax=Mucilaginibacter sp. TaxID=1882438 RepID=UPI0035BC06A2
MSKHLNINLEALRGYAALFVVFGHLGALGLTFNPSYKPTAVIVLAPSSHLFLLVFFVLSGYVIAASNSEMYTLRQISTYLYKRFIRIYPIYVIALIITLLISSTHYTGDRIFWNFALLQCLVVPQFLENGPAWSLHFEVLFYLLFIPVAYFRFNFLAVFFLSILIALANFAFYPNLHTPIISSYMFGFSFWIGGACLARYAMKRQNALSYNILLSTIFFMLAVDQMVLRSGLPEVVNYWTNHLFNRNLLYPAGVDASKISMSYKDLAFIPYCVYAVLIFSGKKFKYEKFYFALLTIAPIYSLILLVIEKHPPHVQSFVVPVVFFILSLLLRITHLTSIHRLGAVVINFGSWLGSISYGIYIIHAPLIFLFGKVHFGENQVTSYIIKVILLLAVTISLAYLLERIFQPFIKRILLSKKPVQTA